MGDDYVSCLVCMGKWQHDRANYKMARLTIQNEWSDYTMKKTNNISVSGSTGTSISTVVQIVFIILKLVGLIDWHWAVVLIPLWIGLGILVLVVLLWLLAIVLHVWHKK